MLAVEILFFFFFGKLIWVGPWVRIRGSTLPCMNMHDAIKSQINRKVEKDAQKGSGSLAIDPTATNQYHLGFSDRILTSQAL